ncbi:hypothetical protein [Solirubrobacter soli]|uniref:hypothetical protein n=1 Tax=Solirubrobacter soli TaxID=363832 RepID=UPI00041D3476|nr:hypothetical protein [Solirubrobacter soli]
MRRALILAACLGMAACGGGGAASSPPHGGGTVADRCADQANGDPAKMTLCLARHHVAVAIGERARPCLRKTHGGDGVIDCLKAAAR